MSAMPPQPHSVTSFPLLCLDNGVISAPSLHSDIISDVRSAHPLTQVLNENTRSGSSPNFLPSPFLSQCEKHSLTNKAERELSH